MREGFNLPGLIFLTDTDLKRRCIIHLHVSVSFDDGLRGEFGIAFTLMCPLVRLNEHTDRAHQAPLEESLKKRISKLSLTKRVYVVSYVVFQSLSFPSCFLGNVFACFPRFLFKVKPFTFAEMSSAVRRSA